MNCICCWGLHADRTRAAAQPVTLELTQVPAHSPRSQAAGCGLWAVGCVQPYVTHYATVQHMGDAYTAIAATVFLQSQFQLCVAGDATRLYE